MGFAWSALLFSGVLKTGLRSPIPSPPAPEPFEVVELPLPPVAPSEDDGACTATVNPRQTGCFKRLSSHFQGGDFTPDSNHVVVNVEFTGAPRAPDPASIYTGQQLILVKADGTQFSNGDPWKCLTCGVVVENAQSLNSARDYPHVFRSGDKVLWGLNIIDCNGVPIEDDSCTSEETHIYPIHWTITGDGSGPGGRPREMRLHPDDVHIGWSSFTTDGGQFAYFGRLIFNPSPGAGEPLVPRYELVDVNLLVHSDRGAPITSDGNALRLHDDAIVIGELRGFSGTGDEILYIGAPQESTNIDLFAVHIVTGKVRRLTSHPEYADPIAFSHDNEWFVVMDTRGSERQLWMSAMRWIPPLVDIVAISVAASTRNNGHRRFFQPILIDRYGDREGYYGQQVNADRIGVDSSVNDPNWNGRADPAFSPDGTKITYWQALVTPPACGCKNPLPCPDSTVQGSRRYRIMLAHRTSQQPKTPAPVFDVPDYIPWASPFPPGTSPSPRPSLQPGNYTLRGKIFGVAKVELIGDSSTGGINTVSVSYQDYADKEDYVLNGFEQVTRTLSPTDPWENLVDWYSNITQSGVVNATKVTSPEGFHLQINVLTNIFNATGTLTTTIDGVAYKQPANET